MAGLDLEDMSVSLTRELLRLPPWEAIIEMINRRYHMTIDPLATHLVALEEMSDNRLEITIALFPSASSRNMLPPTKKMTVVYERLDLARFFGSSVSMGLPNRPVSTLDITQWLTQLTGVVFDKNDVIHEMIPIDDDTYQLNAHPRSLRWVGGLTIVL